MYLIGLTGNIACGKSTVVAMLRELGAAVCDADAVTHLVQAPGAPAHAAIVAAFGPAVLREPGDAASPIDRPALGRIVFGDPAALRRLEEIIHPAVRAWIWAWLDERRADGSAVAVIDAIKLLESGWPAACDAVWVVTAAPEQQLARLMGERGMSGADARQRIAAQNPQADKVAAADVVIDNSGTLDETRAQVLAAWRNLP
ncbi:MAG TPA: dephospho-CoA kinase [Herpetosiphonaceae bacterium]